MVAVLFRPISDVYDVTYVCNQVPADLAVVGDTKKNSISI